MLRGSREAASDSYEQRARKVMKLKEAQMSAPVRGMTETEQCKILLHLCDNHRQRLENDFTRMATHRQQLAVKSVERKN